MFQNVEMILEKIKRNRPLVLNITNYVTMDFVANGLLSLGASPVMSNALQEIKELVKLANVVVINIGTLDDAFIDLCEHVCTIANQFEKPIILDPVGAGASNYRTNACMKLLSNYEIAIVRGNASEILALNNAGFVTKGVDSTINSADVIECAQLLSKQYNTIVVMSGEIDVITDEISTQQFSYGSKMMSLITGTGCLLSAIVATFAATEGNLLTAAAAATVFYGICGETAAKNAAGPGSFRVNFLDALSMIPSRKSYDKQ